MVLGTPCDTVLLPVKVTGPFITGLLLAGRERKAMIQIKTATATITGSNSHGLKDLRRLDSDANGGGVGAVTGVSVTKSATSSVPGADADSPPLKFGPVFIAQHRHQCLQSSGVRHFIVVLLPEAF